MRLRRCTQGLCLISFIFLSCSLVLDSMAFLLAGSTLGSLIIGQYLLFDHRLRQVVSSITVERVPARNPVRKGTATGVVTRLKARGSPRLQVTISDCIPHNTNLVTGIPSVSMEENSSSQNLRMSYRILPVVHGPQQFPGLSVRVRDTFFETTFHLARDQDCQPILSVLPTGIFAAPSSDGTDALKDTRRSSIWSGIDVHSLREYSEGDDLRHADWKISAKYDKIFIRKYVAPMSHPPLIIADLPWSGAPFSKKEFGQMITEVTSMAKQTIQTFQYVSILIISGPNVLHLIREERNVARCIGELREWLNPQERTVHFYRMPDRSDIRALERGCEFALMETTDPQTQNFFESLQDRYNRILLYQRNPAFSAQIARTLSQIQMSDAILYTLGYGDSSHVRHVVRPLKSRRVRVVVKTIGSMGTNDSPDDPNVQSPGAAA